MRLFPTRSAECPLAGQRILVTRAEDQAGELSERLRVLGAEPIPCATIRTAPPADWSPLDTGIDQLSSYDWVIFTSANGARYFFERAASRGHATAALHDLKVGAVGRATARALGRHGIRVDFVPDEYVAEALVAGIGDVAGQRILLPRADIARRALADGLAAKGALVDDVVAYRTLPADPADCGLLVGATTPLAVDIATFTSASTVRNFVALLGERSPREVLAGAIIACIGPITAHAAEEAGLHVDILAPEHTLEGLLRAIITFLEEQRL